MNTKIELQNAVKAYVNGDKESFSQIYEQSYKYLHTCVIHVVKDEEIAMDMLQETYLEISRSISQLKSPEGFLAWAATIANRKCYSYLKKQKDIVLYADAGDEEKDDFFENIADNEEFIPEAVLQDREKQRLIREIIDSLTDIQRLCVIGFYYNEQKQEEIAEELDIPVNTVKSHLNRAKAKIKEAVVELDEKKGTRLYSFAPFMLLLFGMEAEACEFIPMNHALAGIGEAANAGSVSMGADTLKTAGVALKTKIMIGVAIAGIAAVLGIGIVLVKNNDEPVTDQVVEETTQQEQMTEEITQPDEGMEEVEEQTEVQQDSELQMIVAGDVEALPISYLYDYYGCGNKGMIPVGKDGKYGLVTYDNRIVVPLEYDGCCVSVNEDGQSYFRLDNMYYIFDQSGNEICSIDTNGLAVKSINEGVIFASYGEGSDVYCAYYSLDGQLINEGDFYDYDMGATAFSEGYAFYSMGTDVIRMDAYGKTESMLDLMLQAEARRTGKTFNGPIVLNEIPIGPAKNGYYLNRCSEEFLDTSGHLQLRSVDSTSAYAWDVSSVFNREGLSFYYGDAPCYFATFQENGTYYYNNGTIMCVYLELEDHNSYYLVDVSKTVPQEVNGLTDDDAAYVDAEDYLLTEEALIANEEYIGLNGEKYWLIKRDGRWGFIDHEGDVMAMYDDATDFCKGQALIIEDGKAYLIDDNLNKIKEIGPAQGVRAYGELFSVTTESGAVMVMP